MKHQHVSSSSISSIGYDPDREIMHVEFASGQTYEYRGVDSDTHDELMRAESVGAHFAKHIRPHYTGERQ